MKDPTAVLNRCTVQRRNGSFCDARGAEDMPFPICQRHADKLYRHMDADRIAMQGRRLVTDLPTIDPPAEQQRRARARERYAAQSVVYYVRIGDHVKIGYTINLKLRLSQLRLDADALLATEPGGQPLEAQRHREFATDRIGRREDFRPSRRLVAHIADVRREHGVPVITTWTK